MKLYGLAANWWILKNQFEDLAATFLSNLTLL